MRPTLETIQLPGLTPYAPMLDLQRKRHAEVAQSQAPNTLYLLEHAPVITLGRKARPEHILHSPEALAGMGIDRVPTDRGGDVTYHGPGQLVAYPILRLQEWTPSIGWYLRALEEVLIQVLARLDLEGERLQDFTGVWVRGAKVAAIGIGIRDWTTYHGIALNIAPAMDHFRLIVPCGIQDKPVTSLAQLLEDAPSMTTVATLFEEEFRRRFGI